MSLSRRVGLNTATQVAGRLVNSTMAFAILALLLPRLLERELYGVFAFHHSLYLLLTNVLDFGSGPIVVREASRDRAAAGRLIGMLVVLKARFALFGAVALVGVAFAFEGWSARSGLLALAALHLFAHAPAGAATIFAVEMRFGRVALASVLGQSGWLLATVALALAGVREPAAYLLAFGAGICVNSALIWSWARRLVRVRFDASRDERRALWSEVWPAGISMTMAAVYFYIDTAMLRPLAGEGAVAVYSAAYRLMTFALMIPVLFSQVILPVFSRLWALGGGAALAPFQRRCTRFLLGIGALLPAVLWPAAPDVMALVYPAEYAGGARSLAILSTATVIVFAAYPHVLTLIAAGQQRLMMRISTGGALLNVGLNLALIPRFGIEGAAWTTVATEAFVLASAALCAWWRAGVRYPPGWLLRPALCAAGASGALALLLPHLGGWPPAARVGLAAVVGVVGVLANGVLPLQLEERETPVEVAGAAPAGSDEAGNGERGGPR